MIERNREHDRFGPRITEISDEDPTPPLFAPCVTRPGAALLSIKIPRRIERRRAHPGMDQAWVFSPDDSSLDAYRAFLAALLGMA